MSPLSPFVRYLTIVSVDAKKKTRKKLGKPKKLGTLCPQIESKTGQTGETRLNNNRIDEPKETKRVERRVAIEFNKVSCQK